MDHDHSGSINFTDFVAGCLVEKQVGEAALRTAFARLDHSRQAATPFLATSLFSFTHPPPPTHTRDFFGRAVTSDIFCCFDFSVVAEATAVVYIVAV